jgi:hypothetical protein
MCPILSSCRPQGTPLTRQSFLYESKLIFFSSGLDSHPLPVSCSIHSWLSILILEEQGRFEVFLTGSISNKNIALQSFPLLQPEKSCSATFSSFCPVLRIMDFFFPDRNFYPTCILDPGSNNNKRGGEKPVTPLFSSHKFKRLKIILFLNRDGKNLSQLSKNYSTLTQKIVTKLPKIWSLDQRCGIRIKPDPGPGKSNGSWIRNTALISYLCM